MQRPTLLLDRSDDLEPDTLSVHSAFEDLENDILMRLGTGVEFEVRLVLEVMKYAARDGDEEYFLGHTFKYHCYLLGLDSEDLLEAIAKKNLARLAVRGRVVSNPLKGREEEVISKYKTGNYTKKQLAKEYHVGEGTMTNVLKDVPLTKRFQLPITFTTDVVALRTEGLTIKAIARHLKVDNARVLAVLKPLGMNVKIARKKIYYLGG